MHTLFLERTMKKHPMLATAITLLMTMPVMTSCTEDDDNPVTPLEQEELADATILWYGAGGGNVDAGIMGDFHQFYSAKRESFDRVNIVAQYKVSLKPANYQGKTDEEIAQMAEELAAGKTEQEIESMEFTNYFTLCHPKQGATYRFAIDPEKTLRQQLQETVPYGKMNCDITCPDSLTNFINWAAKTYPAKKYILVMADHGGGYLPNHDVPEAAPTRGLVFDDGYQNGNTSGNRHKCFSGKSFARAVKNADVRIEGIVLYLCLMNNMEFLYEVKDVTDYIACSTYVLWGTIGAMQSLPDNMAAGLDTRTALANFVDANVDSWDKNLYAPAYPEAPNYYDMTLTETKRLNDLAPVLKEFTDRLVDTYQNGTAEQRAAIDECTANAVKVVNQYPLYDMAKYMESLYVVLPKVFDEDLCVRFVTSFNDCIAHQRYAKYLTNHNYQVDYSVMLAVRGNYVCYVYDGADRNLQTATVFYTNGTTETYLYVPGGGDSGDDGLSHYEIQEGGTWPSTFANTYQQTTFDHLVGWSRWLLINESTPPAWSPSSFNFQLPEDDMSEIPIL